MGELNKEVFKKAKEYTSYIDDHIENVQLIWEHFKQRYLGQDNSPFDDMIYEDKIKEIDDLIDKHDLSKDSDEEFGAYRRYFYSINEFEKESSKEEFKQAWNHHQKANKHHWQYWVTLLDEEPHFEALEMSINYIIEMLCDWSAMSFKFGNVLGDWFSQEQEGMLLHDNTLTLIIALIPLFERIIEDITGEINE